MIWDSRNLQEVQEKKSQNFPPKKTHPLQILTPQANHASALTPRRKYLADKSNKENSAPPNFNLRSLLKPIYNPNLQPQSTTPIYNPHLHLPLHTDLQWPVTPTKTHQTYAMFQSPPNPHKPTYQTQRNPNLPKKPTHPTCSQFLIYTDLTPALQREHH